VHLVGALSQYTLLELFIDFSVCLHSLHFFNIFILLWVGEFIAGFICNIVAINFDYLISGSLG